MNFFLRFGALLLVICLATSCNRQHSTDTTKHYSEEMLQAIAKISDQTKNRDTGIYLLDSLYGTFPSISAADKYRYYDFKRQLFEFIRFGDRSYDTAIVYLDSMIAVIEDNKLQIKLNVEYIKSFNTRGEYYTRIERYEDAIKDISQCRQLNERAGDSCLLAENNKTLSSIAIKQSNYPLAASLLKEALKLAAYCKNGPEQFKRMQRYFDDLGFVYGSFKKYDSALVYEFAAINYVDQNKRLMLHDSLFIYEALENIYGNIGVIYSAKKDFLKAEYFLKKSIELNQTVLHDTIHLTQCQYMLGIAYFKSGRINEAEKMAKIAEAHIDKLGKGFKAGLLLLKIDIAKEKKQYKAEASYREELATTKDSLYQGRIDLLNRNPFNEYEKLDKKYQVELLKKENQNQQNKTNAIIAIGVLLALLAIISSFLVWRLRIVMKKRSVLYKELKKAMDEKEVAQKKLREQELSAQEMQLQMKFNETIIEQRSQISDDMHDELSNSLAALKFYVEDERNKLSGTTAEKSLSAIAEEVSSVYQTARNYMHGLKTNNWETKLSLIGFLKEIRQKFSEKRLMTVNLNIEEEKIKSILTTFQHDQLYNICSEAITNIIKYSRASVINIDIKFEEFTCKFMIDDNGIGFNESVNMEYGLGLNSMRKRAADLAGILKIESSRSGTKIWGEFPI